MSWRRVITRRNKEANLTGSQRFDFSCRNHGSCPWCFNNRMYNTNKRIEKAKEDLQDYLKKEVYYGEENSIN
jgi:hypothetical protein